MIWHAAVLNLFTVAFFIVSVGTHSCLYIIRKVLLLPVAVHLFFPANLSSVTSSPGDEPQTETQVEKVSTLSLVRRDTALLFRDFRQGASNWIHSLLDSNRASSSSSTAGKAPPGVTGMLSMWICALVFLCACEHVQSGGNFRWDVDAMDVNLLGSCCVLHRCNLVLVYDHIYPALVHVGVHVFVFIKQFILV